MAHENPTQVDPGGTDETLTGSVGTDENPNQIEVLEALVKEKEAKYLYLYADFENYKKRAQKERADFIKFAWEPVAEELVGTLDHLKLAVRHAPEATDSNLLTGLNMVVHQFQTVMEKNGVQEVKALHAAFDPNLHEAVSQEVSDQPAGTIIQVLQEGYTLHGRLLRAARVVVSQTQV